jgi:hypothetical protein
MYPYYVSLTFLRSQNRTSYNGWVLMLGEVLTGISDLEALRIGILRQSGALAKKQGASGKPTNQFHHQELPQKRVPS